MTFESMRVGGGRCPPLLVGGLLIICLMLVVNWYSLSSENLELLRQLDDFGEQIKISAEERDQCMTLRANLEQRFKKYEEEVASLHVRVAQQTTQKESVEISLTACKTELSSLKDVGKSRLATIDALHLEKERTSTQLNETKDDNKRLHEELEKMKNELEAAKAAINAPKDKKPVELEIKAGGKLDNGQLASVPISAVEISQPGLQGMKFHGIPILPQDPPGAARKPPRFAVTEQSFSAQPSAKVRNNVDNGGGQDSQDDEEELKKQINNMISAHNPFDETDDVGDEEKEQKLVTNEEEKQKSPTV